MQHQDHTTPFAPQPRRRDLLRTAGAAGLALATGAAWAQGASGWPSKPVNLIVPFPAGGGTDAFARPLAAQFSKSTGKTLVIDNRGGAGGTVGASAAAKAPADGYNLFMGGVHHVIAPSMYPKLDYDIEKDFIPLALLASVPQVLVVNPRNIKAADMRQFPRSGEGQSGQVQLRLGRRGHLAPPGGRAVQAADGHLHHPHSVPRRGPGAAGPDSRQRGHDVRRPGLVGSAHQGRAHQGADGLGR